MNPPIAAPGEATMVSVGAAPASRQAAVFLLGMLTVSIVLSYADRYALASLIEPIRREFGLTDTEAGLLSGMAFALLYVIAGVPMARYAERGNRRNLLSVCMAIWSLATMACGISSGFAQLLLARFGVGLAESGTSPASHAMIADSFPPARRAMAFGIFSAGINGGILIGVLAGGWLGQWLGWRETFLVIGAPGLAFALLFRLTVREPQRGRHDGAVLRPGSLRACLRTVLATPSLRLLFVGHALMTTVAFGIIAWAPALLVRVHGLRGGMAGTLVALVVGGLGALGPLFGGAAATALARRDPRWRRRLPAICGLVGAAGLVAGLAAGSVGGFVAGLSCYAILGCVFVPCDYAVLHDLLDPLRRATVVALLLLFVNIVGFGIGPVAVGLLSDVFARHGQAAPLARALACLAVFTLVPALIYWRSAARLSADLARIAVSHGEHRHV